MARSETDQNLMFGLIAMQSAPDIPNEQFFFTSSNLVKQVFKFTDREKHLIPANVHAALSKKFGHTK